jgi:monovalent cation:H+ antiporter-2, CPA2 family
VPAIVPGLGPGLVRPPGGWVLAAGSTDIAVLLVELGAILMGLAVLGRLAHRAGISPIPMYLLAGLAFGDGGLAPLGLTEQFVEVGAELGVILLLFTLGLEYTAGELRAGLRLGVWSGVVDLLANFTPGAAAGLLLGWGPVAALVLGGVTYVSSSGVVAKVLGDLGWLGNRETPTVLSILVIEDLAMAVYLPLLVVLLAGAGLAGGLVSLAAAVGTVAVILTVALRYGDRISRWVFTPSDEALLLSILGLTLLVAGVAQRLQVSSAVGAFLAGIAISGTAARQARQLLEPLRDLFAAIFFLFFGLRTDPSTLPEMLPAAIALAAVTALTKVAAGWWSAGRAGVGPRGRLRAGLALIARGEFSIVVAGLGVAAGIQPALGPLAAGYVLLLAVAGPLLTRAAAPLATALRLPARPSNAPQPQRQPQPGPGPADAVTTQPAKGTATDQP